MGLDYADGCVNFRDVGGYINLICKNNILVENRMLRGGSIDYVTNSNDIGNTKSIINLRNGPDPILFDADYYHFPMSNKIEKYDTSQKEVKVWLNEIISIFENPSIQFPVLVHCLSGKDRTGIVVAAILLIIGIDKNVIIEEYLLSEGEVKEEWITLALQGMENLETYFERSNLTEISKHLKHILVLSE